jgi:ABC-2 type transport system permease protein
VFTFALPVLLVSNVPVRVLANKISSPSWSWLLLIGVGLGWAAVAELFWRVSVRRYTSASS